MIIELLSSMVISRAHKVLLQTAQSMLIGIWKDLLVCQSSHSQSWAQIPHLSPNSSQYTCDREGRNNFFQKNNRAKPKGEFWLSVSTVSHKIRKKIIQNSLISAAGSTCMFWSDLPCQSWTSFRKTNYFFYSSSIPPQYQNLCREMLLSWLLSLRVAQFVQRNKGHGHEAGKNNVLRCCMRASNVGLLHYTHKGDSRLSWLPEPGRTAGGKGMEGVQNKARINVNFSHANGGEKLFAESHFPSFSSIRSWHVTMCLVCNTGEGKLVEVISLHFWILSSLNKRLTTSDIGFLCLMNPWLPLLE